MTSYTIEYSKSNRAGCKTCKAKIDKGVLRVGYEHEGAGDFMVMDWRHLECQKKPKDVSISEFKGFDDLKPEDQKIFEAWFESGGAAAKTKKCVPVVASTDGSAPADMIGLDIGKMNAADLKKKLEAYGLSTAGKKAELVKRLQVVVDSATCEAKVPALGLEPSIGAQRPLLHSSLLSFAVVWLAPAYCPLTYQSCIRAPPWAVQRTAHTGPQGELTRERPEGMPPFAIALTYLPTHSLTNSLTHLPIPRQVGGNKTELVARCVDGALYGALPRCPDCGAGKLQVRYPAGVLFGHALHMHMHMRAHVHA